MSDLIVVEDENVDDTVVFHFLDKSQVVLHEVFTASPPHLEVLPEITVMTSAQREAIEKYTALKVVGEVTPVAAFECAKCKKMVPEAKFAFSARAYTPVNSAPFSVVELKCPDQACAEIKSSVVIPGGSPFSDLPKYMKAALRNEVDKLPKLVCTYTSPD